MRDDRANLIVDLSFEIAILVVAYSEEIRQMNRFEMASQVFRSGTSIGANIREAQNGESRADFIHKLKVAAKELDELRYWLAICKSFSMFPKPSETMEKKLDSAEKVLSKIISTSKRAK